MLAALAGCVTGNEVQPVETRLDPQSALTVHYTGEPYVLVQESALGLAQARDFMDLRLIELDRMGERRYLLSLVSYTTVGRRDEPSPAAAALDRVGLRIGTERFELERLSEDADETGARGTSERLFPRRIGQTAAAEYPVSAAIVRRLAEASEADLRVELGSAADLSYVPWQSADAGLRRFAEGVVDDGS